MNTPLDTAVKVVGVAQGLAVVVGLLFAVQQLEQIRHQTGMQTWISHETFQTNLLLQLNSMNPTPRSILSRPYDVITKKATLTTLDSTQIAEAQKLLGFISLVAEMYESAPDETTKRSLEQTWRPLASLAWARLYPVLEYNIKQIYTHQETKPHVEDAYRSLKVLAGR